MFNIFELWNFFFFSDVVFCFFEKKISTFNLESIFVCNFISLSSINQIVTALSVHFCLKSFNSIPRKIHKKEKSKMASTIFEKLHFYGIFNLYNLVKNNKVYNYL